jgi:hypothetical protein
LLKAGIAESLRYGGSAVLCRRGLQVFAGGVEPVVETGELPVAGAVQSPARLRRRNTQRGDRVRFEPTDIFLPDPDELLQPAGELEGVVVGFSDSGAAARVFAVVEVVQKQEVVVPVDKLHPIGPRGEE